ncbi:division/cell wall cluster transcriptional repressor MraZ [Nocardioides salsibiostraticola]
MRFMGTYTPKLDEKGRLFLPAKYREPLTEGVVVSRGQENCLVVWPPEVFDQEAAKARELPQTSRSARGFSRMLFSASEEVVPDKQGRIGIASVLRDYASLEREVVVIGNGNRLEIWNPVAWAEYQAEEARRFAELDDDEAGD